jgi:hypothetical protein
MKNTKDTIGANSFCDSKGPDEASQQLKQSIIEYLDPSDM